jgi:hypothetical protein
MEAQPMPLSEEPRRSPVLKLVLYFVGLFAFSQIVMLVFRALEGSPTLQNFAKLNQIISQSLNVVHDMDAVIVTVWSLILACLLVLPVGWVYMYTKAEEGYDRTLVQTLVVMGMVVCGMMMLIQDQFSRALALVGVVSAVRFRTNLRDPKDAVYMLIAIGVGMGAGLQVYRVAAWLTIVMCAVFLIISKVHLGERPAGAPPLEEKKKKDKKKDKKKEKKEKKHAVEGVEVIVPPAVLAADRLERIADSLQDPHRAIKRPNTAILLDAVDAEAAMGYIANTLARYKAPWHLVTFAPAEGATHLEYMVRLDGDGDVLAAVARDIEGSCGTTVRTVEARFVPDGAPEQVSAVSSAP